MVPFSQDFYLLLCFFFGFVLFRFMPRSSRNNKLCVSTETLDEEESNPHFCSVHQLRMDFAAKRYEQILEAWPRLDTYTIDALNIVVSAFLALGRPEDVGLFIAKSVANLPELRKSLNSTIAVVSKTPCEVNRQHVATALADVFAQASEVLDVIALETLVVAFANVNDESQVKCVLEHVRKRGASATLTTRSSIVQGFLGFNNQRAALEHLELLASSGCGHVPIDAAMTVLERVAKQVPVDTSLVSRVERLLRFAGPLSSNACCALVCANAADQSKALSLFGELTNIVADSNSSAISEISLVSMISACLASVGLLERILLWVEENKLYTVPVFLSAVKILIAANQPERVCALYHVVIAHGLTLDDTTRGKLAQVAMRAQQPDLARNLSHKSCNSAGPNFVSLIRACGQEGNVPRALEILRECRSKRGDVETAVYNCALDVCVSCGDQAATQALFEEMKSAKRFDVISYNTLLKQYVGAPSSAAKAEALVEEMRLCGIKPNLATYNSFLNGSVAAGDFGKAWRCIDSMERSGLGADAYTISIIFKGFKQECRCMDASFIDRALALIKKFQIKLDEVLVSSALEACSRLKDARRLANALDTFKRSGWTMKECNMQTSGTLIKAYGHNRQLPLAWQLWREIAGKGVPASEQLYGQMIDALVTNCRLDDAMVLFAEMKRTHGKTIGSQGFAVAYAIIIRGHAQRKESAKALGLYEEMIANGTKVGLVVFNTLVDACSRVMDVQGAARIFQDMIDAQCLPDLITYSTLIKGYCACGEMDQAMQLFVVMRQKQIQPDAIVYNSLLDGCAKKQMVALCEKVLADMQDTGVSLSNHSVSILVKLYGRSRDLEKAFSVVDDIPKRYGFVPNVAVFTCLMQACIWNGSLDRALGLRSRMLEERQHPDEKTYSTLLRGALRAGKPDLCASLIHAALEQGGPRLLNEEIVQSVLALTRQRRVWDEHGLPLLTALRLKGIYVNGPPEVSESIAGMKPVACQHPEKQTRPRQTSAVKWSDVSM